MLGSGPHVLRGMELYHHRLIGYSLANLAGFHNFSLGGRSALSGLLRVRLEATGRSPRAQ
ncbi:MAG: CapA family protein [Actinomycetota bacterium]|nr:CapA family protein [Actinomycetota bacterium]